MKVFTVDRDMKTIRLTFILIVYLFILGSCSEDGPTPLQDCYEIAKQLEREQFEAYQNFATVSEIQAIRRRYVEEYPHCRWD